MLKVSQSFTPKLQVKRAKNSASRRLFWVFWTYLQNCLVKSFKDILPICNDFIKVVRKTGGVFILIQDLNQ